MTVLLLGAALGCGHQANEGGTARNSGLSTFACGTANCTRITQYCFSEEWNGAWKVGPECRPMPAGCSTCGCAKQDAVAVTLRCASLGMRCTDGQGTLGDDASSETMNVMCEVP
jgi:hypothetical protein